MLVFEFTALFLNYLPQYQRWNFYIGWEPSIYFLPSLVTRGEAMHANGVAIFLFE